jgi:transposase
MRVWAEKGKPLEIKVKQGYKNFYIYSSVSPHTGESFSLFMPEVNIDMMNVYLKELQRAFPDKKLMLIMDQASWHTSDKLMEFENIQMKFLPSYSPELNPIEKLWWWLRKERIHNIYLSLNVKRKKCPCSKKIIFPINLFFDQHIYGV